MPDEDKGLADQGAQLTALAGKTAQAPAVETILPSGRGWYKNMIHVPTSASPARVRRR